MTRTLVFCSTAARAAQAHARRRTFGNVRGRRLRWFCAPAAAGPRLESFKPFAGIVVVILIIVINHGYLLRGH
jgi:hypothetical protein